MKYSHFLFLMLLSSGLARAEETGISWRKEYTLQTPRSRDPVLGGTREKILAQLWFPQGVKSLRAVMCNPFSKDEELSKHWRAACEHWRCAHLGVDFDAVKKEEFTLVATALNDAAAELNHPELATAPLCFYGMSRGGGMSMELGEQMPKRTIAVAPVCLEVGPSSEATRRIPIMTIFGERDGSQMSLLMDKLPKARAQDAHFSIAVQWNRRHEYGQANNLSFVLFDDAMQKRIPPDATGDQPVELRSIPLESGWLGSVASWKKDGSIATVQPWADYQGDRNAACWFASERVAKVWQAFVSASGEIKITQPPGLGDKQPFELHSAKSPVVVKAEIAKMFEGQQVELWDAEQHLATRKEAPYEFSPTLSPGIHSLIVVAKHVDGQARMSRPHTIVVAP